MEIEIMESMHLPIAESTPVLPDIISSAAIRKQNIISGFRKEIVEFLIKLEVASLVVWHFRNPLKWYTIMKSVDPHRKKILGQRRINKIAFVNGKYYWGLFIPSWPSKTFHQFLKAELNRAYPLPIKFNRFTNIFLAVTNKCALACEHCYEWDALNKGDKLTLPELKTIVQTFQDKGVSQVHLSGGEPLNRLNDVLEILQTAKKNSEFWILTSGFHLTYEKARALKSAGLTGLLISLDHVEPEMHNRFRGFKDAFYWVEQAVKNAITANLVTALSICVTKTFVSKSNLMRYMELAKSMGVSFVQILEPRAVGHYKNQDVDLTPEQEKVVEEFYLKMNYEDQYKEFPPICYHGYHQRRMGCWAAGDRSLYVDTAGDLHACPFCQKKTGNVLTTDLDLSIEQLQYAGCHKF